MKTPALFITAQKYVDYQVPGGVQLCTAEFMHYFESAGYSLIPFKVQPRLTIRKRIKIKLGIETYSLYDAASYLKELLAVIQQHDIKVVLFNQLNLAHWVSSLKHLVPSDVKFIGLSHGNESGDYLHAFSSSRPASLVQTWRLGRLLLKEKHLFQHLLDGVVAISKNDSFINQWLGVQQILFLPRILFPDFISWNPVDRQIGFVGTLDHLPNLQGLTEIADDLKSRDFQGTLRLVGGPPAAGRTLAENYSFISYAGVLSPDELIKEAAGWSLFLNPVFWYSRGSSTKLAQGINWGLPVVSTPAGTRGYELTDHRVVCEDNTAATFVDMVLRHLNSESWLGQLKQATENNALNFRLEPWIDQLQVFVKKIRDEKIRVNRIQVNSIPGNAVAGNRRQERDA
ncbi:glycosyltransferase [Pedobacter sp. AW31-3R]|uniref:glycosyltransferase n=1 Tax=Pedobacter sp. AW31-3R TaxID=3445781 RepID=UPI003F9F79DA